MSEQPPVSTSLEMPPFTKRVLKNWREIVRAKLFIDGVGLDRELRRATRADNKNFMEICGLLIQAHGLVRLVPIPNVSREILTFEMKTQHLGRVIDFAFSKNFKTIGAYHSHGSDLLYPSDTDILYAYDHSYMLILGAVCRQATLWRIDSGNNRQVGFGKRYTLDARYKPVNFTRIQDFSSLPSERGKSCTT